MWNKFKTWFMNAIIQDELVNTFVLSEPVKSCRKSSDTTKITKGMYDFVIERKRLQEEFNKHSDVYQTTEELCAYLNMVFNTNFSRSKFTRIWTGKINRENLPEGTTYIADF